MPTVVHCTVTNCIYWGDWNYCAASAILVIAGEIVEGINAQGSDAENMKGSPAGGRDTTMCYTFQPAERS